MKFLDRLFASSEEKYQQLVDKLNFHEGLAKNNLHSTHPHLQGLLEKHNLKPEALRYGGQDSSPHAVLGALLAFPDLTQGEDL
jgi:hypothetical protein